MDPHKWTRDPEQRGDGLAPRKLPAPCLTIVCDGCGAPCRCWPNDDLIAHFANASDAWADAGDVRFGKDGTAWHEDCAADGQRDVWAAERAERERETTAPEAGKD